MADGVFNIAKGRVIELHDRVNDSDPTNAEFHIILLKVAEADGTLEDYATMNALLAGSNTEADFTGYIRKYLTDADVVAATVDNTNNWRQCDIPTDPVWSAAGGTLDNTLAKVIVAYDPDGNAVGNDTTVVPLCHYDFTPTTNGNDLVLQIDSNGYFRAS
jgi:hypothetical protein